MVALLSAPLLFIPADAHAEEINRFDAWKTTAITSPKAGELKAAGPIEVEFQPLNIDNLDIDYYDLYMDGELEDRIESCNQDSLTGKVYTTEVSVHNVQVVAVTEDDHEISSSARKFMVSKKGLNVDDKAVKNQIEDMNESWYYNWGTEESSHISGDKEFVPMIWGRDNISWLQSDNTKKYSTILGFNEPDLQSQSNLSVEEAANYQNNFTASGLRVGSVSVVYPINDWFQQYSNAINMDDIDFIPVHIYYDWGGEGMANAFLNIIDETYEKYHKPIWVTEYGLANAGLYGENCSEANMAVIEQYMKDTIKGLEERDYVERYTWFNFGLDSHVGGGTALYNQENGELTKLGELYQSLGNPNTEGVDFTDEYIEDDAYYKNLDDMITKAESLVKSDDYKNYINVEAFEKVLKEAKDVNRHYGSYYQYLIDNLTSQLEKEYNQLKKATMIETIENEENEIKQEQNKSVITEDETSFILYLGLILLSLMSFILLKKVF